MQTAVIHLAVVGAVTLGACFEFFELVEQASSPERSSSQAAQAGDDPTPKISVQ